jgi:hypothetical protein
MKVLDIDAQNKLCPIVNQQQQLAYCVADQCMGWRYESGHIGYCGFAGKPDNRAGKKRG